MEAFLLMNRCEKLSALSRVLCNAITINDCPHDIENVCMKFGKCRIDEKTDPQLEYILSSIDQCVYLEACAGSGKTEVLGMKAAYELQKWNSHQSGIAVLTFTNEATATITDRVSAFYHKPIPSNHFIGTFSSFVHGYISQKFGYKFYRNESDDADMSFRIIDSDINLYNNLWLQNYKLDFPISNKWTIYANQLNYRAGTHQWFYGQGESSSSLEELFRSSECQHYIAAIRKKNNWPYAFQLDYLKKQVEVCKRKFWKDGFATFEDMNIIAHKCLQDNNICSYLVRKFPVILVDECQDLSANELIILSLFIKAGAVVHYIGDLHQSIYSFKDSYPEFFSKHIGKYGFKKMNLSDNFRSTQKIVDVSRALALIQQPITGTTLGKCEGHDCSYFEYHDENEAISGFSCLLKKYGIPFNNAVVLVRNQSMKAKLIGAAVSDYRKHSIINATQLWQVNSPDTRQKALRLLGWQLQKWMNYQGNSKNYYFSDEVCSDAITWRSLLRDILEDLCASPQICDLDNVKYGAWYASNKTNIMATINNRTGHLIGKTIDDVSIRTPKGTAKLPIEKVHEIKKDNLRVETIHSVKGDTFDAVLLLSAPDGRGKAGYWENWLNAGDETGRIGYVACTRPKYLLCWGVSKLTDEQRAKLEGIGFEKYDCESDRYV